MGAVLLCEPGSLLDTDSHGAWISVVFSHIYTPYKWRMKFCCALTSMGMTWEEKNYKIWVSSYSGVLFWRLHFFGFSNSVSKVKRYVQCCAVGTDSRYLISERVAHSAQPSQAKPQHYFQWRISFHGFII